MSISHDEAAKWSRKETLTGIIIGLGIGGALTWFAIDYFHKENKESYTRQINELKEERNKLDAEKSTSEKNFAICQTEKTNLENSIRQSYVSREEFNRCLQTNSQITEQNKRFNSQQVNNCLNNRRKWQKDLDTINEELRTGETSFGLIQPLTEQQLIDRRVQQQQLLDLLKNTNCN